MEKELQKRILSSIILLPLSFFFIIKGSAFFILFLSILFVIACLEWFRMTKTIEYKIFGTLFLLFSFYTVYFFRDRDLLDFLLILIICITTDIGGYIFGKIFKGPKLIKISPNKTYAGMIGSFLFSIVLGYLIYYYLKNILNFEINILILIVIISFISQIGDLSISLLKRKAKIKDTGSILPGHGGILDRLDGIMLAIPLGIILISI